MSTSDATERAPRALLFLYAYTIVGAGVTGAWTVLAPSSFASAFGIRAHDPFTLGIVGCVYAAFGVVAALGVRAPLVFAPIFLVQLGYKLLWLVFVLVPNAARGAVPLYGWVLAVVYVSYVVLDLVALPFARWFGPRRRGLSSVDAPSLSRT